MLYSSLTPYSAAAALEQMDHPIRADEVVPERRGDRWMVRLPGARMAWFAARPAGLAAMRRERCVLRILQARCGFAVPRVVGESGDGAAQVRAAVPGPRDGDAVFHRARHDREAAIRLGGELGAVLAELHAAAAPSEVDWLPRRPAWPEARAEIRERLPHVTDDRTLRCAADRVMARYDEALEETGDADRVLLHGDLGLHSVSADPDTLRLHGVFDWDSACVADRHLDFRYLILGGPDDPLLDAAVAAYEPRVERRLSFGRIYLYNAAAAVGYLAFRAGVPAEVRWCGRTLAEDLAWTRSAIARAS